MQHPPVQVLNLDRRPERWDLVSKKCSEAGVKCDRMPAVDGKEHELTADEKWLFRNVQYQLLRGKGPVGCALSHLAFWRTVANGPEYANTGGILLEDDSPPSHNFRNLLQTLHSQLPADFDLVYLTTQMPGITTYH